jgi:subtilisin family serine protease
MRRVLSCLIVLGALALAAAFAVFLLMSGIVELPFTLPLNLGGSPPPTATASSGPVPVAAPIAITTTDGCRPAAAAAAAMSTQAGRQPRATLPNGRPFPGVGPRRVNIPNRPPANEVIIQFASSASQQERSAYLQSIRARSRRRLDGLNALAVTLPPNVSAADLPPSPIVTFIEPDYIAGTAQVSAPNDPRYSEQWGLPVIGLPQGWAQLAAYPATVTVAVIDSGICAGHPDLAGRVLPGFDFVDDDTDPTDVLGHGCGVAGVIAASSGNQIGIAGVAPNARILPLRVLDANGLGQYSNIAAAIIYAADQGARVINLSLAGPQYSQAIADAVDYAARRGVILIAAAGNNGTEGAWYPAALPSVVAVGSIDPSLTRSAFSNYGANVPVLAPGRDILTTALNGDYTMMTGTSFAAPHVAGIAALALAYGLPLNTEAGIVYLYPPNSLPVCP